ncbi:MAG: ATP-binding cassette domain-containing protein [Chloroflexi bacterium]|nr:MAG: ATP-binding cassette domain-containing protein [Chloroflexota bacterium]
MTADPTTPTIALHGLTKRYGVGDAEHTVLDNIDLTIEKGEFIAIMGPSGCGKTTLLNILGLLDRADEGIYKLDGKSVKSLSGGRHSRIRSEQIGFVFQNFNLIPRMNVIENVALPLTYSGYRHTKRLQLARASHVIMEELSDIHKRGNTIIMVTHNPSLTTYASRVITMNDGRIDTDTKVPREAKKIADDKRPLSASTKKPAKKAKKPKKAPKKKTAKKSEDK